MGLSVNSKMKTFVLMLLSICLYVLELVMFLFNMDQHLLFAGASYESGEDFCRGQKFRVAENGRPCFNFNPFVFSSASIQSCHYYSRILLGLLLYSLLRGQLTVTRIS